MAEEESLHNKATTAFAWSAFERFGQLGCAFIVQIVLARLLAPELFGLIAMVAVFITISNALIDAGFSKALIQRKQLTDLDVTSVFYFNLSAAILMASFLYAIAPAIAQFYASEELISIVRLLSVSLIFSGLGAVHQAKLSREMQFKKLFYASFPATLCSGILGVLMALLGYGVWALVAQTLLLKSMVTVLLWKYSGWGPSLAFDFRSIREMFPYASRLAASGVLDAVFSNAYVLVIGKVFNPIEVGLFQRARSFQQLPAENIQMIVSRVTFPLFASVQDDPVRMRRGMRKTIFLVSLLLLPGMALLAAIAEPMILLLIGEKWLASVPYLQLLCIIGALYPLHAMNVNLLAAIGRSDLFLRLEVIKKSLMVVNIFITYRFGVQVMICGMIVTSCMSLMINTFFTKRFLDYGLCEQIKDLRPIIILTLSVFAGAYCLSLELELPPFLLLCTQCLLAGIQCLVALKFFNSFMKDEISKLLERLPMGRIFIRTFL